MRVIESCRALACELEVLPLVLADGHVRGAVDEDVGGLQDGVGEEAEPEGGGDGPAPAWPGRVTVEGVGVVGQRQLALPLRHARQVAHGRGARQHPHELGVRRHRGLVEDCAARRVQPDRQQRGEHLAPPPPQLRRLLRHRDGVQVHHREQQPRALRRLGLQRGPPRQGAEVVPQVRHARGLDP